MLRIERGANPGAFPLPRRAAVATPWLVVVPFLAGLPAAEPPGRESLDRWKYYQEVKLPPARDARLYDFVLPPEVFDGARADELDDVGEV